MKSTSVDFKRTSHNIKLTKKFSYVINYKNKITDWEGYFVPNTRI